jgi:hypothetical protein
MRSDEVAKLSEMIGEEQMQQVAAAASAAPSSPRTGDNGGATWLAAQHYAQVNRRAANNLLPPTPFSQTVPVITGPLPQWSRRLEAARDLEADRSGSDSDDEAIFDEFLLSEIEGARNEKPRSEKRGEFFRLPMQDQSGDAFLKIWDCPPPTTTQKDANYAALEYLAVSRPEFAPALRRLAPWQMHLVDWPSLFRGGTHENVSVTKKPFPHGAAWAASPFSEAPTHSGGLGFVGNLRKRDNETAFFTKLHSSHDGRVDPSELAEWVNKSTHIKFVDDGKAAAAAAAEASRGVSG